MELQSGNPLLDQKFFENTYMPCNSASSMLCLTDYQQHPQFYMLPALSPYDNFLKAAGCWLEPYKTFFTNLSIAPWGQELSFEAISLTVLDAKSAFGLFFSDVLLPVGVIAESVRKWKTCCWCVKFLIFYSLILLFYFYLFNMKMPNVIENQFPLGCLLDVWKLHCFKLV